MSSDVTGPGEADSRREAVAALIRALQRDRNITAERFYESPTPDHWRDLKRHQTAWFVAASIEAEEPGGADPHHPSPLLSIVPRWTPDR